MAETIVLPVGDGEADTDEGQEQGKPAQASEDKKFTQADIDRVVADRVARERSKYSDYGDLKKKAAAAMSDQDKALAEAEQRGRSAALQSQGTRLAKAEFRATAAGKVSPEALDGFLEYADMKRFVDEDGEPDNKAIAAAIKKLAGAAPTTGSGSYDGGVRTTAEKPKDMNDMIRRSGGFIV